MDPPDKASKSPSHPSEEQDSPARSREMQLHTSQDNIHVRVLAHVSDMVNGSVDTFTIIRQIMEETAALLSAQKAMVLLYSTDRDLNYLLGSGFTPDETRELEEVSCLDSSAHYLAGITSSVALGSASDPDLSDWASSLGIATLIITPLLHAGQVLGFLVLAHSQQRDYADEDWLALRTLSNLMAFTVDGYRAANTANAGNGDDSGKDRFLSALSHELRTPLTSIIGFTQIIRKRLSNSSQPDPRLMDHLDVLWTQAQRLNRLIDTFVDISNVERGEFAINLGKVELVSVLRKAVDQSLSQDRHKHEIVLNTSIGPIWVLGDSKRLEQVFSHLLSNALRYSPEDQSVDVLLDDHRTEKKVLINITDYGPGISSDRLKSIFERFYQKDTLKAGGLGVGLYISKMILEAHGGHISIESSPGQGTSVSIILPA